MRSARAMGLAPDRAETRHAAQGRSPAGPVTAAISGGQAPTPIRTPPMPTELERSSIYSALILATAARPMGREAFRCVRCGREHFRCKCFSLPNQHHHGSGAPSPTSGPDTPSIYEEQSNATR